MRNLIVCVIVMFSTVSCATSAKWSDEDVAMATVMTTATLIDWGQTRDIVKKSERTEQCTTDEEKGTYTCIYSEGHREANVYLGKKPSMKKVDTYMPLLMLTNLLIADWLSEEYRGKFLYGISFLEINTIAHNHSVGLRINF